MKKLLYAIALFFILLGVNYAVPLNVNPILLAILAVLLAML